MSNRYGYDITIREVMNGFVVRVGCEHIVIQASPIGTGVAMEGAIDSLCATLREYLKDRKQAQKMWYETHRPDYARLTEPTAEAPLSETIELP